jgi:HNH endonuclease
MTKVKKCIFCENELTKDTKPEHVLLSCLGGRKKTREVDCSECNTDFGSTIDNEVAQQVAVLRNMLHLESGTGNAPPMLKNVRAGKDTITLTNEGLPELVSKPFKITDLGDGRIGLQLTDKSPEDAARYIPHIAAQLRCSEEQLLELLRSGTGTTTTKRPDTVHHGLAFGGPEALRSMTKSSLVLWALSVGNEHVRSSPYAAVRRFILEGDEPFNLNKIHLDSRQLPQAESLKEKYGKFFNLIYVRSDEAGRVIAHFTLYNILSWQIILAETGGEPNLRTGLISNPLDPVTWSDTIADELDIDFGWLTHPDYDLAHAHERFNATGEHYFDTEGPLEQHRIIDEVFAKHGITDDRPVTDPELFNRIISEASLRLALHALGLPHMETLTGDELVERMRKALKKGD